MMKNEIKQDVKNMIDKIEDEKLLWMLHGTVSASLVCQEVNDKTE